MMVSYSMPQRCVSLLHDENVSSSFSRHPHINSSYLLQLFYLQKCKGGMFPSQEGSDKKPVIDDSMDNETVDSDVYEPRASSYVEMTDPSTQQLRVSVPPPPPAQSSKFGNLSKKIRSITIMRK